MLLVGPRASGKSFTCERITSALGGTILRLDDPAERRVAAADPTGYIVNRTPPVLIDEYQHVPELLSAIKADLSRRGTLPGRFLLTGSVRADLLGSRERLTGRIHRARLYPLSVGEFRCQEPERFLDRVLDEPTCVAGWRDAKRLTSYDHLEIVSRGGFPLAVERGSVSRSRWFRDHVRDTVLRDALEHANIRKPDEMLRLLRLLATRTGQIARQASLSDDLQLDRHTVAAYRQILQALFLVEELPAWRTNRSQRLVKAPKIHLADTGLATALLGLDVNGLRADPTLAGHLLESLVVGELRKQTSWLDDPPAFLHFVESERAEVDLVLERSDGGLVGIEVKLADHAEPRDLRGIRRLRDLARSSWVGGVLLAAVPAAYTTDDGIAVAPISAVWNFGLTTS